MELKVKRLAGALAPALLVLAISGCGGSGGPAGETGDVDAPAAGPASPTGDPASTPDEAPNADEAATATDVGSQMARGVGAMHAMARACDEATDKDLAGLKQKLKAQHGQFGMDPASFDAGYAAGEREASQQLRAMSAERKAETCNQVKQQFEEMARQLGQL